MLGMVVAVVTIALVLGYYYFFSYQPSISRYKKPTVTVVDTKVGPLHYLIQNRFRRRLYGGIHYFGKSKLSA